VTLQLQGISVDIGGRRSVSDVDIAVDDGEFVGLLGPNGSGKSTLLKAFYRLSRPVGGRVLLDGTDPWSLPARQAARRWSPDWALPCSPP
jgi:iron complex transport system ATP-binding protein